MSTVVISNQESPKYSENLYPYASTLNESVVITHNEYGVAELDTSVKYNRLNSIRAIITNTSQTFVFNIGDATTFTAPNDGTYIFSFRLYMSSAYSGSSLTGRFTNFQNSAENQFDFANTDANFEYDKWNTYTQIMYLEAGDLIENEFKLDTDTIGTRVHIGGLKAELDDRNIGLPSRYSEPFNPDLLNMFSFDFNNGVGTQAYTSGSLVMQNDGAGAFSYTSELPYDIYNITTDEFDFSGLNIGDVVMLRLDVSVTTTAINQFFKSYLELGQGVSPYPITFHSYAQFKTADTYENLTVEMRIVINNELTKNNPAQFIFESDSSATLRVNGWNGTVLKKN